jgi:voltage-dependent potassium channel beta subunit
VETRYLGRTGLQVSALSLGSWITFGGQIGDEVVLQCMGAAREAGVNFFDNAEVYAGGEAETVMGRVIRRLGWKRSDVVISTKIFWGGSGPNDRGLSRKHVIEGTRASLSRLQMDYVDLIFCHRPDPNTPMEETVRAMNFVLDQGWAFYWGTSEWSAEQIMQAHGIARREHLVPPAMEQPEYNMFNREKVEGEYQRLYGEIGLGTTTWSPLASGLLTGKYDQGIPDDSRLAHSDLGFLRDKFESDLGQQKVKKSRALQPIADRLGCTRAQLALAWCLRNPEVSTVITGASRVEQVVQNMEALDVVAKLSPEVLAEIEAVLENQPDDPASFR